MSKVYPSLSKKATILIDLFAILIDLFNILKQAFRTVRGFERFPFLILLVVCIDEKSQLYRKIGTNNRSYVMSLHIAR